MSSIKLKHSGGNGVIIAAPSSNPASDRTLTVPSNADGTILTTGSSDADRYKTGEVVQVVTSEFVNSSNNPATNGTYTSIASTGLTATITPKFSNSKIIFEANLTTKINDEDGHARWQIYDATNARTFHNNTYCGASHYYASVNSYIDAIIRCVGTAVNTNAMTLAVRVQVNSGGTLDFGWSGSDNRLITLTEIKV